MESSGYKYTHVLHAENFCHNENAGSHIYINEFSLGLIYQICFRQCDLKFEVYKSHITPNTHAHTNLHLLY